MGAGERGWTRREWLRRVGMWSAGVGLAGGAVPVYARWVEAERLAVEQVRVLVRGLPDRLAGYTIAQLSDFHADRYLSDGLLAQVVEAVHQARPDLLALTGDFITNNPMGLERLQGWFGRLEARQGVWGCLGNHDLWNSRGMVGEALRKAGVELLVNRGIMLPGGLFVAGVESVWGGRPDLSRALRGHDGRAPVVLLAHEPDLAEEFCQEPRVRLQLSGHTHGGQVRVPGWGAPILPRFGRKYDAGLFRVGGMQLYTNRGLGMVGVPFRLGCPPELTLLRLEPAVGQGRV